MSSQQFLDDELNELTNACAIVIMAIATLNDGKVSSFSQLENALLRLSVAIDRAKISRGLFADERANSDN